MGVAFVKSLFIQRLYISEEKREISIDFLNKLTKEGAQDE